MQVAQLAHRLARHWLLVHYHGGGVVEFRHLLVHVRRHRGGCGRGVQEGEVRVHTAEVT